MIETIKNGGPFMIVLFILAAVIIFLSLKNIKQPYYTNGIILIGIFTALIGILATYLGINRAFNAISNIADVSPIILINGLKVALITSYTGGIIMLISTALWYSFVKTHNLLVV